MSMHKGILGQSTGGASVKKECCGNPLRGCMDCPPRSDVVLGDYIARKQRDDAFTQVAQEKKLTFEEWFDLQVKEIAMKFSTSSAQICRILKNQIWGEK